jgi:hypothetical protein
VRDVSSLSLKQLAGVAALYSDEDDEREQRNSQLVNGNVGALPMKKLKAAINDMLMADMVGMAEKEELRDLGNVNVQGGKHGDAEGSAQANMVGVMSTRTDWGLQVSGGGDADDVGGQRMQGNAKEQKEPERRDEEQEELKGKEQQEQQEQQEQSDVLILVSTTPHPDANTNTKTEGDLLEPLLGIQEASRSYSKKTRGCTVC